MKNIIARVRSLPKRFSILLAVAIAAITVPAVLYAWGPNNRTEYTMTNPADHVVLNSIVDNPKHGNEFNFVRIRNFTDNGSFGEQVNLEPGKEYEVYVYYHNNASVDFNTAEYQYRGIASGAFMRVEMPATVPAGNNARINGYVGASNANPALVWDEAYAKNDTAGAVLLRYVPNSAVITSNGQINGQTLDLAKLASQSGHPLGYDALDGKLPGCTEFAGYVTYRFVADQPNFEVTKQVSLAGKNDFKEEIALTAGTEVQYKIQYKNTGTIQQDNVVIRDALPAGVSYIEGSTYIANSKTDGKWSAVDSNTITKNGINIGSYAPGGNAYIAFKAKVNVSEDQLACGVNKLINTAYADTENGSKNDTATVTIDKDCPEKPEAVYSCDALSVQILERTKFKFNVAHTVKNATLKSTTYVVRDSNGQEVYRGSSDTYNQTTIGKYTVEAELVVTIDGKDVVVPVGNCKAEFEVKEAPAPDQIRVCNLDSKTIIDIDKNAFDENRHTTDFSKCQTVPTTPIIPGTPSELPQTGAMDAIANAFGLGMLSTTTVAYLVSRRNI